MRKKVTFGDIVVIMLVVTIMISAIIIPRLKENDGIYVNIVTNEKSEIYNIYDIRKIVVESNGYIVNVVIDQGNVYISESNCNDKICVNTGVISRAGESIVCAPAKVIVFISGGDGDVDHIIG